MLAIFCVGFGFLMSMIAAALTGIDRLDLELEAQEDEEAKHAIAVVFPVLDKYHWLLMTLLFANALVMEALPIAFKYLMPDWLTIIVSAFLVLVFC